MDINELNGLLKSSVSESETLEFKIAKDDFDKNKLGKYFSALSNEANLNNKKQSYLFFGINDNKEIVGTNIGYEKVDYYKKEISDHTTSKLTFSDVSFINTKNGNVIVFTIPAAPKGIPVDWKGHYYARNGSNLGSLNIEKIERIRAQEKLSDWSANIIAGATINDLSREAIEFAKNEYIKKNPRIKEDINTWDDITFLNKARICINGKITNTAILLLGKPEAEHFISPSSSKISWILKDKDNMEKDYEHFYCPLLLSVNDVAKKIRNLKYRYLQHDSIFPNEVEQYSPYIIREALNNCIAHQDYTIGGKINVIENEDSTLTFINVGTFIPNSIEHVITIDYPENIYRNKFLVEAMVNLNMIDTIGSGIKKMFKLQIDKFFPLPEYDFNNNNVKLKIIGKVIDINYSMKLALEKKLTLLDIFLLDRVSKKYKISKEDAKHLKSLNLIEGRNPNYIISSSAASIINQKTQYIIQRGLDDEHYIKLILSYLTKFNNASRKDIDTLLLDKLPDVLDFSQKKSKIRNILQKMRKSNKITLNKNKQWVLYNK